MYADRLFARLSLTKVDIAGVQAIYGPVPVPSTTFLLDGGLLGLVCLGRNRFFKKKTHQI